MKPVQGSTRSRADLEHRKPLPTNVNDWAPRSCHHCSLKKIRCDKKRPCHACARSSKTCSYPPPGPRVRRTKKAILEDKASHAVNGLENPLTMTTTTTVPEHTADQSDPTDTGFDSPSLSSLTQARGTPPAPVGERSREDVLVQRGSSSQYFNGIILSRVLEEVSLTTCLVSSSRRAASCYVYLMFRNPSINRTPSLATAVDNLCDRCTFVPQIPLCFQLDLLFSQKQLES